MRAVIDALGVLPDGAASEWARRFELAVGAPSPAPEAEGWRLLDVSLELVVWGGA